MTYGYPRAVLQRGRQESLFELADQSSFSSDSAARLAWGQDLRDLRRFVKIAGADHLGG